MLFYAGLREKHQQELENLTLTAQPFKTLKFFILAIFLYIKRSISYLLAKGGWLMLFVTALMATGFLLITIDGPHEKVFNFFHYLSGSLGELHFTLLVVGNKFLQYCIDKILNNLPPAWRAEHKDLYIVIQMIYHCLLQPVFLGGNGFIIWPLDELIVTSFKFDDW